MRCLRRPRRDSMTPLGAGGGTNAEDASHGSASSNARALPTTRPRPSYDPSSPSTRQLAVHANRRERADHVLGQAQGNRVGLDIRDRADRNRHFTPPPEMAALEDEVRDLLFTVN